MVNCPRFATICMPFIRVPRLWAQVDCLESRWNDLVLCWSFRTVRVTDEPRFGTFMTRPLGMLTDLDTISAQ